MEIKQDLKVVLVRMTCDKCKVGEMVRANNEALLTQPAQYEHVCKRCGNREKYFVSYPSIRYEYPRGDGKVQVVKPSQYEYKGVIYDYAYDPENGRVGI